MTAAKKDLTVLQKILNHGIRVIFQRKKYDHIGDIKGQYYWSDIENLATIELRKLLNQMREGSSSSFLNSLLRVTTHNRTRQTFYISRIYRTRMGQKTISNRAPMLLNSDLKK